METLRFLMVTTFYPPAHVGGDAVHVKYLSEALAEQGHEVHVEYSPAAYRIKRLSGEHPVTEEDRSVHIHPIPGNSGMSVPAAYFLGESRTVNRFHERLVRDVGPDVIHLHNISLLGVGVQRAPAGQPVVYTAHDYWFRCPRSDLLKNGRTPCDTPDCLSCMVRSRRLPALWRRADIGKKLARIECVIAPSLFMSRLVRQSFACPVVHIPNFVPDENRGGRVEPALPFYLYAGVLERHKGIVELARAARRYRGPGRFVLVGRGSLEGNLRALSRQPESHLEVRPWMRQQVLSALYRTASAFLMPSVCLENAPLSAIEALSWGLPLLTTDRGGVSELLHDGTAGYAFEPDANGILSALNTFERAEDSWALRVSARKAYETYHRPQEYLARYLAVVHAVVNGERTGTRDGPRPEVSSGSDTLGGG